jgi:hypothetical protein
VFDPFAYDVERDHRRGSAILLYHQTGLTVEPYAPGSSGWARALLGPRMTTILIDWPMWMLEKRSRLAVETHVPFLPP